MKKIKITALCPLLFVMASFLLFSCNKDTAAPLGEPKELQVQTNAEEFARILATREQHKGPTFEIKDLKREDNSLKIKVEGPGSVASYKVVWDGVLFESYPAMARIVVAYTSIGEVQHQAIMTHELTVDLKELFGPNIDPADVTVNVSNGSQPIDTAIDPNGSVSNK